MTVTELLARFSDPQVIHSLSTSDKLLAGLATTILGMGITFSALVILQFVIAWMDKILNRKAEDTSKAVAGPQPVKPQEQPRPETDDGELVAVIATAIATQLKTTTDRIVIKNIEKIEDRSPSWNRAGIVEQMNNRL
jgi:sodium pump decarboxylase gamma subunit